MQLVRRDELAFAGLMAGGILVGFLWQWYSPRPVGDRLVGPALLMLVLPILFLLPMGELHFQPGLLLCGAGIGGGVVLADLWHRIRATRDAQQ